MRTLSSSLTFFYKYVFFGLWCGGFGFGTISMFLSEKSESVPKYQFLVAWLIGTAFIYLTVGRIKKVQLVNGEKISVSNYIKTVQYNVSDIVNVSGSLLLTPELVWFTVKNEMGDHKLVVLMPHARFTFGFTQNPLVRELKELKNKNIVDEI